MKSFKAFIDRDNIANVSKFMLWFMAIYIVVTSAAFYFVLEEWKDYVADTIRVVEIQNKQSPGATCDFIQCEEIIMASGVKVHRESDGNYTFIHPLKLLFYDKIKDILSVYVTAPDSPYKYKKSYIDVLRFYADVVLIVYLFILVTTLIFIYRFIVSSSIQSMISGASVTASLHNKNMSMLAEQLHHEINTPLTVVKTLCDRTMNEMEESAICDPENRSGHCKRCTIPDRCQRIRRYHKIIDDNIRQAYVVIERMAEVKQVRYSNGNKTLYDIAKATFDIMGVYNRANYNYNIDESLREYIVDHNTGLKNHEVMNMLVNHVKNSLEAGASDIRVVLNEVASSEMSVFGRHIMDAIACLDKYIPSPLSEIAILLLDKMFTKSAKNQIIIAKALLIDNGRGISGQFRQNIFNLNWSSKKRDGIIRGAGLYLNREILRTAGGDVDIVESSPAGTTFILFIPVIKK